jgi:Ni2+-binding GTPase involved in maturation of urease and hydrogenase
VNRHARKGLAMTKVLWVRVCHCEEDSMDDAAIHRASEDADDLSLHFLNHSGSPRPQGARDDKSVVGA